MTSTTQYHNDPVACRRHKARQALWHRVDHGSIKRRPCCCCGSRKAEAHHADYARAFRVAWVCRACHRRLHDAPTPEMKRAVRQAFRAQLPEALAVEARAKHREQLAVDRLLKGLALLPEVDLVEIEIDDDWFAMDGEGDAND